MPNNPKRFVIEGFNHFIKEVESAEHMNEEAKNKAIAELNKCRNAYIIGLISEREALKKMIEVI